MTTTARTSILDALRAAGHTPDEATQLLNRADREPRTIPADTEFRETLAGGHALVVEYGDCEFHGSCQCGKPLGTARPDRRPLDVFAAAWERHCMTEVPSS